MRDAFVPSGDELGWDGGRGLEDRMQAMTRACMERLTPLCVMWVSVSSVWQDRKMERGLG
jgi:hypothetical protein